MINLSINNINLNMQLIKKREIYAQQIRRKQRQEIKSELRITLLMHGDQEEKQQQIETRSVIVSTLEEELSEKKQRKLKEFYEQMKRVLTNSFPQLNLQEDPRYLDAKFLDICHLNIRQQRKQTLLQQLGSAFQVFVQVYQKYFLYYECCDDSLEHSQASQEWKHSLNIALIQLKMSLNHNYEQSTVQMYFKQWVTGVFTNLSQVKDDQQRFQKDINIKLEYTLKEIKCFCEIYLQDQYSQRKQQILQRVLRKEILQKLNFAIRNYRVSDKNKIMISIIFVQLVLTKNKELYDFIIQEYLQFIRMTIAFTEAYRENDPYNENVIANRSIFKNILNFIQHGCQIYSSNIFWEKGICSQLKFVQREGIKDRNIHEKVAEVLFQCIVSVAGQKACEYLQEADMMDWLLIFLNETIQNFYWSEESKKRFIQNSILIIEFFFQLGENMKMSKSSSNPYEIKFRYSFGEEILGKCEQGIEFLGRHSQNQEHV